MNSVSRSYPKYTPCPVWPGFNQQHLTIHLFNDSTYSAASPPLECLSSTLRKPPLRHREEHSPVSLRGGAADAAISLRRGLLRLSSQLRNGRVHTMTISIRHCEEAQPTRQSLCLRRCFPRLL